MSQKYTDLFPDLSEMTTEELMALVKETRRNKYEVKPAKVKIEKRYKTKEVKKILKALSPELRAQLLKEYDK